MCLNKHITNALSKSFVKVTEVAYIVSAALASKRHLLITGPGGYGKSEMIATALASVAEEPVFVQSCGEGLDEASLWGGLDCAALNRAEGETLRYQPEKSWLNNRFAVLEEIFDAPANVLLSLKDTMTARELRKGDQRFGMKTDVLIGLSNRPPQELLDLGPAVSALIERFTFQHTLQWEDHKLDDYKAMLNIRANDDTDAITPEPGLVKDAQELYASVKLDKHHILLLSGMAARAADITGRPLSPRATVYAAMAIRGAAAANGREKVEEQDFFCLEYVSGCGQPVIEGLRAEIDAKAAKKKAETAIEEAKKTASSFKSEFEKAKQANSVIRLMQVAKKATAVRATLAAVVVTDDLTKERDALLKNVDNICTEARKLAEDAVSVS